MGDLRENCVQLPIQDFSSKLPFHNCDVDSLHDALAVVGSDSRADYCYVHGPLEERKYTLVGVGEAKVEALLDTDASFNYVRKIIWNNLSPQPQLSPMSSKIQSATGLSINFLGSCEIAVEIDGHKVVANFLVSDNIAFAIIFWV